LDFVLLRDFLRLVVFLLDLLLEDLLLEDLLLADLLLADLRRLALLLRFGAMVCNVGCPVVEK
jgi:hypothetical protein